MKRKFGKLLQTCLFLVPLLTMLLLAAAPVMAGSVTYDYTGNAYDGFSYYDSSAFGDRLTASFTFDTNYVIDHFTGTAYSNAFLNGHTEITSASVKSGSILFSIPTYNDPLLRSSYFTFVNGNIVGWLFNVKADALGGGYLMLTSSDYGNGGAYDYAGNYYYNQNDSSYRWNGTAPGTWTKEGPTNQVPEPATMLLLGLGIAGLAGVKRKLRK